MHTLFGRGHAVCHCREVVRSLECPLSEVPLYFTFLTYTTPHFKIMHKCSV